MTDSVAIGVAYRDQKISGGSVDNTPVGATTTSTGAFTTLTASGAADLQSTAKVGGTSSTVGFYGVTGTTRRASSAQSTLTYTATTGGVGFVSTAQFTAAMAALDEVMATLTALNAWKGSA